MPHEDGKKLFHAIVVVGAAIGGCGGATDTSPTVSDGSSAEAGADTEATEASHPPPDATAAEDVNDAGEATDAGGAEDVSTETAPPSDAPVDVAEHDVTFPHITR